MPPTRAHQRTNHAASWLYLLSLTPFVSASCTPPSDVRDRPPAAPSIEARSVAEDNNRFALDLYAQLRTGQSENVLFAPASLSTALTMAYAGARGQTAAQMAQVLHLRLPQQKVHSAFGELHRSWDVTGTKRGYRLNVANRLWGQQGPHCRPGFLDVTREHYGAELTQVDFARQTEQARRQINDWVEERTQRTIRDLIPAGVLDSTTRLVLTDAIAFKGKWTEPFLREATQFAPFHLSGGRKADVPLMYQQGNFRYWAGDGLKLLELPYGEGNLALLILLPDEANGLPNLEANLTHANLSRWQSGLRKREVRVYLPRLRLDSQFRLADMLQTMGMTRAFTPGEADLTGMSSEQDLFLADVIHNAFIEINEEGTEAAAATAVGAKSEEAIAQPLVFRADHPFAFLIRDHPTGSLLFLGRLVNPQG